MDVPRLAVPGVEADDVIGTMATRGVAAGMEVAVASPDKVGPGIGADALHWLGGDSSFLIVAAAMVSAVGLGGVGASLQQLGLGLDLAAVHW